MSPGEEKAKELLAMLDSLDSHEPAKPPAKPPTKPCECLGLFCKKLSDEMNAKQILARRVIGFAQFAKAYLYRGNEAAVEEAIDDIERLVKTWALGEDWMVE